MNIRISDVNDKKHHVLCNLYANTALFKMLITNADITASIISILEELQLNLGMLQSVKHLAFKGKS
jgi:hypothetical protein